MAGFFPEWSLEKREAWSIKKEARFRELAASSLMDMKTPGLDRLRSWLDQRTNSIGRAAVTNAPRLNAESMIDGIRYNGWFQTVVIGDECARPKPDPCPYLDACEVLHVTSEQCIVFEDSPSGATAGIRAGCYVVGITSSQDEAVLREAGCHLVIQDFEDEKLWELLDGLGL
mmetsp:Transcript_60050/g.72174  ORF Transcript_60050/g.72174 Transcript_60050/m.72174 type:complete len:172 (-) Transcript_60050:284-799(-)